MAKHGLIELKVFYGIDSSGSASHGCSIIPEFDKDFMSYFELRDLLKEYGLKVEDSFYYLKPGYVAPNGLVLIMDDNQCNQLLTEHEGRSSCTLYIVPNATRPQTELSRDDGADQDASSDDDSVEDETYKQTESDHVDSSSSDLELVPEHDIENRAIDAGGYVFEGDADDEDLYSLKKAVVTTEKGKELQKAVDKDKGLEKVSARAVRKARSQAKKNASVISAQPDVVYLSDEPNDSNLTLDEAYETPIYVHRSRGLEDKWFDVSTMKQPVLEVGMLFTDVKQFREAMKNLVIREGRKVEKRKRVCTKEECRE